MNDVDAAVKNVGENEISAMDVLNHTGESRGKVELSRIKVMPERMESPPRNHIFHDVEGFKLFLEKNATENTIVFVNVDSIRADAVLDDKARQGSERVVFSPPYHPEFNLLENTLLAGGEVEISRFARAVMRNRKIIADSDSGTAQDIAIAMRQILVSTKTEQATGDGKTSVNGVMTTTKVSIGTPEAYERLELPDSIQVRVPIYLNTHAVSFSIDITISTNRGVVLVTTDSPELDLRKFEVFVEILKELKTIENVSVVHGSPQWAEWQYNK